SLPVALLIESDSSISAAAVEKSPVCSDAAALPSRQTGRKLSAPAARASLVARVASADQRSLSHKSPATNQASHSQRVELSSSSPASSNPFKARLRSGADAAFPSLNRVAKPTSSSSNGRGSAGSAGKASTAVATARRPF